jgi:glycosyltransferase involved in cell wall biosynthesis
MQPLVSVVMNCHNGERFLKEAIESVYGQTYNNWEIIFWDNASTDGSAKIAHSYDDKIQYYFNDKKTSLGEARNFAMTKAIGKYVTFLDCDDKFLPEKMIKQVELMEAEKFVFSYGSVIIINEHGSIIKKRRVKNESGYIINRLLKHYEINMHSVMIDREFEFEFEFDKKMKYCPDYNLFMKIASQFKVGVLSDFIGEYRKVSNSLSSTTLELVSLEIKESLDEVLSQNKRLQLAFPKEVDIAYSKLQFYDAVSFIDQNQFAKARVTLFPIILKDYRYFVIYILLFLPLSSHFLLRVLNR